MIKETTDRIEALLKGRIPEKIEAGAAGPETEERRLAEAVNRLIAFMEEVHRFIVPLSRGELTEVQASPANFLASPFKELHSRLLHLTWQAQQVAKGDFSQRVDFMGEFSEAFNSMILSLDVKERMLREKIEELEGALAHIKRLEGILPICANCKRVRREGTDPHRQENWVRIEHYISERTDARFSHSLGPACMKKLYPGFDKGPAR